MEHVRDQDTAHDEPNMFHPNEPADATGPVSPAEPSLTTYQAIPSPNGNQQDEHTQSVGGGVSWTASEFIIHHKTPVWYAGLGAASVVIAALAWLLTRDPVPTATILIGSLLFGFYAAHKPRQQAYSVDESGVTVGHHHYTYREFRSFSVASEGAFNSIEFTPLKRLAMYTTIYFDPADEDKILAHVSAHLPVESPRGDLTDRFMRSIRF